MSKQNELAQLADAVTVDGSNVGIGTSSPASVSGTSLVVHDTSAPRVRLTNDTTGQAGTDGSEITVNGSDLVIENRKNTANTRFYNGGAERMRIDSSGNVGIIQDLNIGNNDSSNPLSKLRFGATQYGAADIRPTDEGAHKVGLDFYTDGTGDVTINPTHAMRIDSKGRVTKPNQAGFNASSGSQQFITSSGTVLYQNTSWASGFNTGSHYNTSTGRFTCPIDGIYLITCGFYKELNQSMDVNVRVNGGQRGEVRNFTSNGNHESFSGTFVWKLSANDYVDLNNELPKLHLNNTLSQFSVVLLS